MKKILAIAALAIAMTAAAQEKEILALTGAESLEQIDAASVQNLEELYGRPLGINSANHGKLSSSGLFSTYQAASIIDYISRNGSILSISELSLLDGFNEEFARALSPFISLEAAPQSKALSGEASLNLPSGKGKAKVEYRSIASAIAVKNGKPGGYISYNGTHSSVTLGDFNVRLGQGLATWNGLTFSGLVKVASFKKNATGISPTASWSPNSAFRGLAIQDSRGRMGRLIVRSSAFCAIDSTAGASLSLLTGKATFGANATLSGKGGTVKGVASLDGKLSMGKVDLFGEAALQAGNGSIAALAGMQWNPQYRKSAALLLRHYPASFEGKWSGAARSSSKNSDESGISAAFAWMDISGGIDAAMHPEKDSWTLKSLLAWAPASGKHFIPAVQAQVKYRSADKYPLNLNARAEAEWKSQPGRWQLSTKGRLEGVVCREWSAMGYLEGNATDGSISLNVRGTLYRVNRWEDRIYCYQKDVPGSFNVPALYGRGWMLSAYGGWKMPLRKGRYYPRLGLNLRASLKNGEPSYSMQAAYRF